MSTSSHLHRALTVARTSVVSTRASTSSTHISTRRNAQRTVATLSYPLEYDQAPLDFKIFDIFDAPSRLGESSKLLIRSTASRFVSTRPEASVTSTASAKTPSPKIQPLPTPITYDGPSKPRQLSMTAYRPRRSRSMSSAAAGQLPSSPTSLPEPVVFDGPSRLRPYRRGATGEETTGSSTLLMLSLLGVSGVLGLIGYTHYNDLRHSRQPRSSHL